MLHAHSVCVLTCVVNDLCTDDNDIYTVHGEQNVKDWYSVATLSDVQEHSSSSESPGRAGCEEQVGSEKNTDPPVEEPVPDPPPKATKKPSKNPPFQKPISRPRRERDPPTPRSSTKTSKKTRSK